MSDLGQPVEYPEEPRPEDYDYPDYCREMEAWRVECDVLDCIAAGTHSMVYAGDTSLEDDPPYSHRDVYACESCGAESVGIYYF